MTVQNPRIILTTGGTGGHVFPALAVAEEIKRTCPEAQILFMGGQYGKEAIWVNKAGLEFVGLSVRGMVGRGLKAVGAGFNMLCAVFQARKIIREFKPDVVAGFGGYAAFAGVMAAKLCGCPTLIHEQNAIPGVTNKLLGKVVDKVCLSMSEAATYFPAAKIVETGNPVRTGIAVPPDGRNYERDSRHLLVVGGSQGARALNDAVSKALPALKAAGVEIWHQTGERDSEMVEKAYADAGYAQAKVEPFITDMPAAYAWADLGLMRSGASSVAELAVAALPSILIPFPFATHNHQVFNARHLSEAGAAILVEQKDLPAVDLGEMIVGLLQDPARLREMAAKNQALGQSAAAVNVFAAIRALAPQAKWEQGA